MEGERFQLVGRHVGHGIEVGIVDARPAAIRGRARIEGLAGGLFAEGLDRLHFHVGLREGVEQFRQVAFHFLDRGFRVGEIFRFAFRRFRFVEARIGAHEFEEVLQAAFEADLRHDRLHLAVDAGHLVEADLVDFIRRQTCRRVLGEAVVVVGFPVRQLPGAVIGRGGRLLADEFGNRGLIGRADRGLDRSGGARGKPPGFLLGDGAVRGQRRDLAAEVFHQRAVPRAVERVAGDHAARVREHIVINEQRRLDAFFGRGAGVRDMLAEIGRHALEARDIGLGVGRARHLVLVDQEGRDAGLHAEHLVEGVVMVPVRPFGLGALQFVFRQPPGEFGLVVQLVEIERRFHFGDIGALEFQLGPFERLGRVGPFTVAVLDAQVGLAHRVTGHGLVEFLLEPGIQAH